MLYYIFFFCLVAGFWDGYKKINRNKLKIIKPQEDIQENYNGLLDFLTSNR